MQACSENWGNSGTPQEVVPCQEPPPATCDAHVFDEITETWGNCGAPLYQEYKTCREHSPRTPFKVAELIQVLQRLPPDAMLLKDDFETVKTVFTVNSPGADFNCHFTTNEYVVLATDVVTARARFKRNGFTSIKEVFK